MFAASRTRPLPPPAWADASIDVRQQPLSCDSYAVSLAVNTHRCGGSPFEAHESLVEDLGNKIPNRERQLSRMIDLARPIRFSEQKSRRDLDLSIVEPAHSASRRVTER